MSQTVWFFFAFLIVLALIGVAAWLVRRFAGNKIGGNGKTGRMPRLAVIDAAAVDGRRRLVLIRRDNVEHLLMIGGPTDIVVEPNIARGQAQRDGTPQRTPVGTDLPPRIAPLPDATGWDDEETFNQPSLAPEPPRRAVTAERRVNDPFADFGAEPSMRPERDEPVRAEREPIRPERATRSEPRMPRANDIPPRPQARVSRPAPEPSISAADQNLAEMAQRLEAALRRPGAHNGEAPAPQVSQMDRVGAPPVAPEPVAAKAVAQSLEDEMASLLGRPRSLK